MRKLLLLPFPLMLLAGAAGATPKPAKPPRTVLTAADSAAVRAQYLAEYADSVNRTLHYQRGRVVLPSYRASLTVPAGFQYLDSAQSRRVLTQIWRNPHGECLGMLFPADGGGPLGQQSWAYVIEYDDVGYVKDDDADDINYDELLADMQKDGREANAGRTAAGYEPVELLGWAAPPYYDAEHHALHWAKRLRFGAANADADPTLNYNVRLLGRKGVLVLNAVAEEADMPAIKASIPVLLRNVEFSAGQRYADFNPGIDEVAAYTIGGLVAGKVLAKVGLLAVLLKFWKLGLLALGGAWAAVKRFLGLGRKEA